MSAHIVKGDIHMLQKTNIYQNKTQLPNLIDGYLKTFLSRDFSPRNVRTGYNVSENKFPVDMYSDKKNLYVTAQIPGVSKDKINVELIKNNLSIELSNANVQHEEKTYFLREITSITAKRTIKLPAEVVFKDVKSTYDDGMLKITLPMAEPEPRHQIPIN